MSFDILDSGIYSLTPAAAARLEQSGLWARIWPGIQKMPTKAMRSPIGCSGLSKKVVLEVYQADLQKALVCLLEQAPMDGWTVLGIRYTSGIYWVKPRGDKWLLMVTNLAGVVKSPFDQNHLEKTAKRFPSRAVMVFWVKNNGADLVVESTNPFQLWERSDTAPETEAAPATEPELPTVEAPVTHPAAAAPEAVASEEDDPQKWPLRLYIFGGTPPIMKSMPDCSQESIRELATTAKAAGVTVLLHQPPLLKVGVIQRYEHSGVWKDLWDEDVVAACRAESKGGNAAHISAPKPPPTPPYPQDSAGLRSLLQQTSDPEGLLKIVTTAMTGRLFDTAKAALVKAVEVTSDAEALLKFSKLAEAAGDTRVARNAFNKAIQNA